MSHNRLANMLLEDSDSDDDLEMFALAALEEERLASEREMRPQRGSVQGHRYFWRGTAQGNEKLFQDYFAENPVYPPEVFRRRFRMTRSLFLRIQSTVEAHDPYFARKYNAAGISGFSSLQKITAVMMMLIYGVSANSLDGYVRIGESTTIESFKKFVKAVVAIFSEEYLRSPNKNDVARLLAQGESRGFPGMLGSIGCTHWKWNNCPTRWKGKYSEHIHEPTIIFEAVASYDLWIWHAFFDFPGSNKDINLLEHSNLFADFAVGRAPPANYSINGHDYTMGYYLADSIYPHWPSFVKGIPFPHNHKNKYFAEARELAGKDVEKAFGLLQARFAIIRGPTRFWHLNTLKDIMKTCIIMHNMIVEDERDAYISHDDYEPNDEIIPKANMSTLRTPELMEFIAHHCRIQDKETHSDQLQADLIEHLWEVQGSCMNM